MSPIVVSFHLGVVFHFHNSGRKGEHNKTPYQKCTSKKTPATLTGWWFPSTHLINMFVKLGGNLPQIVVKKTLFETTT